MATKVVKTLKFPNSTDEYQINAVLLEGKTASQINTHNSHSIVSGTKADGSTNIVGTSSSGNLTLGDSGVTAGEYGPTANQTPAYGATFNVPDIKVNSKGIVTSVVNRTVKIPASDNSEQTLTVANKSNTDTTDLVYAVTNIVESGTKGHTLTPTYTGLPTKDYVDGLRPLIVNTVKRSDSTLTLDVPFDTIKEQAKIRPVYLQRHSYTAEMYIPLTFVYQDHHMEFNGLYMDYIYRYEFMHDDGHLTEDIHPISQGLVSELTKINGHMLQDDITLTAADVGARSSDWLPSLSDLGLEQAMRFLGLTTTAISDGSTIKNISVNGTTVTATNGDVVLYNGYEYVWTGSAWEQLGQEGSFSLKTHTHTVTHKPAGTVSTPTITVTPNTTTVNSITAVGTLPTLVYEEVAADNITGWSAGSGSASLTGSVSELLNRCVTLTFSHSHTAPSLTYSEVKPHKITSWSQGTLPTKGSNTTVVTGIKSASSTQPTFTGTSATLTTSAANS